jgi:hypothetical protein
MSQAQSRKPHKVDELFVCVGAWGRGWCVLCNRCCRKEKKKKKTFVVDVVVPVISLLAGVALRTSIPIGTLVTVSIAIIQLTVHPHV